jgi:hypothetical protein
MPRPFTVNTPAGGKILLVVALLATIGCWGSIVRNFFVQDDFLHLYDAATLPAGQFLIQLWSGHLDVASNALLLAALHVFGPTPTPLFWIVLATHLAVVCQLYCTIRAWTGDFLLSGLGAVVWGTCPILGATLGFYSVYGQVLATLFILTVLADFGEIVTSAGQPSLGRALYWGILLAAGAASFGSGLALAMVFPACATLMVPLSLRSAKWLTVSTVPIVAVLAFYLVVSSRSPHQALSVPVALAMVLDSTSHVLVLAARLLVAGVSQLVFGVPAGRTTTVGALGAASFVLMAWWLSDVRSKRHLLGFLGLLGAAYGATAAARAPLHSIVGAPLEGIAALPHYQYLPTALLTVLIMVTVTSLQGRTAASRTARGMCLFWLVARLAVVLLHPPAVDHHETARAKTEEMMQEIRTIAQSAPAGARITIANRPFAPVLLASVVGGRLGVPTTFPGWAGAFVVFSPDGTIDGHAVRFIVSEAEWTQAQFRGGRIAELVERPG